MILDQLKSALPLEDVAVIDCHGHLGKWPLTHMARPSLDETIETMDRLGIDQLCLSPFLGCFCDFRRGNDLLGEAVRRHPDRLLGQFTVNPNYPDDVLPEFRRCEKAHGLRMLNQYVRHGSDDNVHTFLGCQALHSKEDRHFRCKAKPLAEA